MATTFYYRARTPEGLLVSGAMVAENSGLVLAHLRTRALFVTAILQQDSVGGRLSRLRQLHFLTQSSFASFYRGFATMLSAGVPMQRALSIQIAQTADRRFREALRSVLAEIESGQSLSAGLKTRPDQFGRLHIAMIEAGEAGGMLDVVMERLATLVERNRTVRRRIAAAFAYPVFVLISAITLVIFLVSTIVPTFGQLFDQLQVPMPLATRLLMRVGDLLRSPMVWIGGSALIVIPTLFAAFAPAQRMAKSLDRLRFGLPLVGAVALRSASARICRMMGSLLGSGVDVLRAVEIVAPLAGCEHFREGLMRLNLALREGESVSEPLARDHVFEPLALQLIKVGEESGSLDSMFLKIADYYENDVESAMLALTATIEPFLIALVGLVVASIVFAIFIPMYSVIGRIR